MAKKPYDWIRDADEPVVPSAYRESRAEKKQAPRRAQRLAKALVASPQRDWPFLGLSELSLQALEAYAGIPRRGAIAKKRQLQRIGTLLLDEDLDALEEAMGGLGGGHAGHVDAAERARLGIVQGGREAEEAFLQEHPGVDRQRLRQLASNARKAVGTPGDKKAQRKLRSLLGEALKG